MLEAISRQYKEVTRSKHAESQHGFTNSKSHLTNVRNFLNEMSGLIHEGISPENPTKTPLSLWAR